MCSNCIECICQGRCVPDQPRGVREVIPSECIKHGLPDPLLSKLNATRAKSNQATRTPRTTVSDDN